MWYWSRRRRTILEELQEIKRQGERIMGAVDDLKKGMDEIKTAVGDAVLAIKDLAAQIEGNAGNPAAMEEAAGMLSSLATTLEEAVKIAKPAPAPAPAAPETPASPEGAATTDEKTEVPE